MLEGLRSCFLFRIYITLDLLNQTLHVFWWNNLFSDNLAVLIDHAKPFGLYDYILKYITTYYQ